jgi:SPP1 family phage portal protein
MIQRDRDFLREGVSPQLLSGALREHQERMEGMDRARNYYDGKQEILNRVKTSGTSNNKLVTNHAKYIVDLASAYLVGSPVGYSDNEQAQALGALTEAYKQCNVDSVDAELARHASIYGKGVELLYMGIDGQPRTAALDPRQAFVVYDNTVAHTPLFGAHKTPVLDAEGEKKGDLLTVYTEAAALQYALAEGSDTPEPLREEEHFWGGVPMVEYWNNEDERGDFEPVLSLIDAYNLLQSDRVNDKEQLVDALLVITGASLGDTDAEFAAAAKKLRDEKIFEAPSEADAKYLVKQLTESEVQVLADALAADIHKIALVPALTDEDFAGTASGVALRYKLLGLEQLTKTKERWFREGLRGRMRLFARVLGAKEQPALDAEKVTLTFSRGLPANDLEQAQMVSMLQGIVPDEILLGQLSFIDDPEEAVAAAQKQKRETLALQQAAFSRYPDANARREGEDEEEE